jgi:hypothetical protein
LGFLAALSRLPGLVLSVALAVEYLQQKRFRVDAVRLNALAVLLPLCGFGVYLLINQAIYDSPFQFLVSYKNHFGRHLSLPFEGFFSSWDGVFLSSPTKRFTIWGMDLFFFAGSCVVLSWSAFRLRYSYTVYGALLWILIFCQNFWICVPRYLMMMFPIYIFVALLAEKRLAFRTTVLLGSILLYALGTIQFVRGWWAN